MIGVICFYSTLLESTFEKKVSSSMLNIIPRNYNDKNMLNAKLLNRLHSVKNVRIIPNLRVRKFFLHHF